MRKKLFILLLCSAMALTPSFSVFAEENETEMDYEELKEEYESLKLSHENLQKAYATMLVGGVSDTENNTDEAYNELKEKYDALEIMYEDATLRIQELEDANSDIPVYDITGTVDELTTTTFTITTSKGNVYTFSRGTENLNIGEKVSFSYKGEIATGAKVQSGTVRNLVVTETAPVIDENNISVSYSVGSYYGSGWEDALICTFTNNSGADLFIEVGATFYDRMGNWCASSGDFHNYFKNGEDLVVIFDYLEFDSYDVEYSVYQTPQYEKNLYENAVFNSNRGSDDVVYFSCSNNMDNGYSFEALIIYYDELGNIIDYSRESWGTSAYNGIESAFSQPIAQDMTVAAYSDYKVYYRVYQF